MTDKEAMKLALDALEQTLETLDNENSKPGGAIADTIWHSEHETLFDYLTSTIAALKERLTQPEPIQSLQCFHCQITIETLNDKVMRLMAERTEQEPYAYTYLGIKNDGSQHGPHLCWKPEYMDAMSHSKGAIAVPLYTHPPQRTEQEPVAFPRQAGDSTWIIDTAFIWRVKHTIDPNTPYDWTPSEEQIETVLLALEKIPSPLYTTPPQRTEQNFCSRCGKRTKDLTHIHTCTPPKEGA
jgi:hypothetical protein